MDVLTNKQYKQYDKLSRYSQFPIWYNKLDDKWITGTPTHLTSINYTLYKVRQNDTYDLIALWAYNNPTYFWIICNYNNVLNPFENPKPGTFLKLPTMSNIEFE